MTKPSQKNRRLSWLTILALMPLAACQMASSDACGTLFVYDRATEAQAAQELYAMKTAGVYPVTRMMLDDYGTTRETIRACR
jgi:hypothetical protein